MAESTTHVFRNPCGCVDTLIVNKAEMYAEVAKAFKYAAKHNQTHEILPTEEVRKMPWNCPQHTKAQATMAMAVEVK